MNDKNLELLGAVINPRSLGIKEEIKMNDRSDIFAQMINESIAQVKKDSWNEAIEAAIKFMVTNRLEEGLYDRMRKELKK